MGRKARGCEGVLTAIDSRSSVTFFELIAHALKNKFDVTKFDIITESTVFLLSTCI